MQGRLQALLVSYCASSQYFSGAYLLHHKLYGPVVPILLCWIGMPETEWHVYFWLHELCTSPFNLYESYYMFWSLQDGSLSSPKGFRSSALFMQGEVTQADSEMCGHLSESACCTVQFSRMHDPTCLLPIGRGNTCTTHSPPQPPAATDRAYQLHRTFLLARSWPSKLAIVVCNEAWNSLPTTMTRPRWRRDDGTFNIRGPELVKLGVCSPAAAVRRQSLAYQPWHYDPWVAKILQTLCVALCCCSIITDRYLSIRPSFLTK